MLRHGKGIGKLLSQKECFPQNIQHNGVIKSWVYANEGELALAKNMFYCFGGLNIELVFRKFTLSI